MSPGAMNRTHLHQLLVHKNDKSEKFWSIEAVGLGYTIAEGTPDSVKTTTKLFQTEEECRSAAEMMLSKKLKSGYKENTAPGSREQEAEENRPSSNTKDRHKNRKRQ